MICSQVDIPQVAECAVLLTGFTEIVAKKVIEIRQAGISDPAQISNLAIKDLGL